MGGSKKKRGQSSIAAATAKAQGRGGDELEKSTGQANDQAVLCLQLQSR